MLLSQNLFTFIPTGTRSPSLLSVAYSDVDSAIFDSLPNTTFGKFPQSLGFMSYITSMIVFGQEQFVS